jgi:hypothetical protein
MGDNIANRVVTRAGAPGGVNGSVQFNSNQSFAGNALFTTDGRGTVTAIKYLGDGGLLSNIVGGGGSNGVNRGTPGDVAYYVNSTTVGPLSNITVDASSGLINIHSDTHATNVGVMSIVFDEFVGNVFSVGTTLQSVCENGNTYSGAIRIDQIIDHTGSTGRDGQFLKKVGGFLQWV